MKIGWWRTLTGPPPPLFSVHHPPRADRHPRKASTSHALPPAPFFRRICPVPDGSGSGTSTPKKRSLPGPPHMEEPPFRRVLPAAMRRDHRRPNSERGSSSIPTSHAPSGGALSRGPSAKSGTPRRRVAGPRRAARTPSALPPRTAGTLPFLPSRRALWPLRHRRARNKGASLCSRTGPPMPAPGWRAIGE